MKVILYHSSILKVGGIETFISNFIKRLNTKVEITLYYHNSNIDQLIKYSDYVDCVKYEGQETECDILLLASAWGESPTKTIKAKKVIQTIHANLSDYKKLRIFNFNPNQDVTHYVSVSNNVSKALSDIHGIKSQVIYNLTNPEIKAIQKPKNNTLTLITACRLSREKGLERCIKLAQRLTKDKIPYVWNIYGDSKPDNYKSGLIKKSKGLNINWHPFTNNVHEEISKADYLVQLSDTEGFCYSIIESLQMHTPVICAPFESGKEQIRQGENGYVIPFDIEFDTKILLNIPKISNFNEFSNENDWIELFNT